MDSRLPSYDQLPEHEILHGRSSWGLFGEQDELGCLNLLTNAVVRSAGAEVRKGQVFNLCLPLNEPSRRGFGSRGMYRHKIFSSKRNHQDDVLDNFYPQASTHWDGMRHIAAREFGFYNEVQPDEAGPDGDKLGINRWADHGFVGRGVLVDVARYLETKGVRVGLRDEFVISTELLTDVIASQKSELASGDILLLRTGFLSAYFVASAAEDAEFRRQPRCRGLSAGEDMARLLWDSHIVAIAADNIGVESYPGNPEVGFLHRRLIPMLGLALGEWFNFEALSEDCAADGRYTTFFISVPLNLPGGVGSPANAVAIK